MSLLLKEHKKVNDHSGREEEFGKNNLGQIVLHCSSLYLNIKYI